ncbi:MAG: hypothetical protein ACYDHY_14390 [Acidiferrobacterales bacterium]
MSKIVIVSVPPGQAPLWVRQKWVGVEIPLLTLVGASAITTNVRGEPAAPMITGGCAVTIHDAISALKKTSPEAAAWWENWSKTMIAQLSSGLVFPRRVCKLTE